MSNVITVENLGKKYLLKHRSRQDSYVALRDVMSEGAKNMGRRLLGRAVPAGSRADQEDFWALRGVSFEVKQGDRVGIIGRNGAGKSTLLKILSRITEPSTGSVRIRGRVASLLEVGTGFHPELTGRENIFLNGAILGMARAEIRKKFDEIVDFAEVEKFLDTPVKRFSSGMYVRLAFAVAAHLEPEILIVDEVLAVGDAQFQKKCMCKMEDVSAKEGRTILFVSHNMGAVKNLCERVVLLNRGAVEAIGSPADIIQKYMTPEISTSELSFENAFDRTGDKSVSFTSVSYVDEHMRPVQVACTGMAIGIVLDYEVAAHANYSGLSFEVGFYNLSGELIFLCGNSFSGQAFDNLPVKGKMYCWIPSISLAPGLYSLNIYCGYPGQTMDWIQNASHLRVIDADFFETGKTPPNNAGMVWVPHHWEVG